MDCHVWYSAIVLVTRLLAVGGREKPDNWITRECQKREFSSDLFPGDSPGYHEFCRFRPVFQGLQYWEKAMNLSDQKAADDRPQKAMSR